MNRQLLKQVRRYNPKWTKAICDYIGGKNEYLNSGVNENIIDINVVDMCIVGEVYNFTTDYSYDDHDRYCQDCDNFGMALWSNSSDSYMHKEEFERLLTEFYKHFEAEHKEVAK